MKQPHLVLLVDDHSLITTAMSALLKSMYPEVQIYTGSSARDARELANKFGDSADLMILDLCFFSKKKKMPYSGIMGNCGFRWHSD